MKIKDIPFNERPREKLIKYGKENLSDSELLAILLKTGTKGESVLELAIRVLKKLGSLENLKDVSFDNLKTIKGIGDAKALELLVLSELSKRIYYKNRAIHMRQTRQYLVNPNSRHLKNHAVHNYLPLNQHQDKTSNSLYNRISPNHQNRQKLHICQ